MGRWLWAGAMSLAVAAAIVGQQSVPLPEPTGPLQKPLMLLRQGKTAEARQELEAQRKLHPDDPEVLYQIARS